MTNHNIASNSSVEEIINQIEIDQNATEREKFLVERFYDEPEEVLDEEIEEALDLLQDHLDEEATITVSNGYWLFSKSGECLATSDTFRGMLIDLVHGDE